MLEDTDQLSPGCAGFWDSFYDEEDGRLQTKEQQHRKAREIAERGTLRNHYEWFMEFPSYEGRLSECLKQVPSALSIRGSTHVLHIGCGNSDFSDHVENLLASQFSVSFSPACVVLNLDICASIVQHLAQHHPQRRYAVGNVCDLRVAAESSAETEWYEVGDGGQLASLQHSSVDMVFDKGTADALLSAFAGRVNPNMESYAAETLKALRPGGLLFLISINSEDVVNPYLLSAEDGKKSFQLVYAEVIELRAHEQQCIRVETLGSRYTCYGYTVLIS